MSKITNMHLVKDAKQFVAENRDEGTTCPCCGQFVKVYQRGIHSLMAKNLLQLYKITREDGDGYYHVNDFAKPFGGGDFAKLRFWGLIDQETDDFDPSKRTSGKWRITEKGKLFCQNEYSVPKKIIFLNGKPVDQLSEYTTIVECLGKKFDYQEMMNARYSTVIDDQVQIL
jgi:hypothetical protein